MREHLNGLVIRFMAAWQELCPEEDERSAAERL